MFYEYAIEPSVLSNWERTRYFIDAVGPSKGRFLAEYPKHWVRLVLSTLSCGDYEKKRIVERLELAKKNRVFFRRSGAPFDGTKSWLDNVEVEHASPRGPFHAIIATEARSNDFIIDAAHLDENHARWKIEQGRLVPREPIVFAKMLDLLFRASSRVVIIDPYFRADQDDKTRPLTEFCNLLLGSATTIEVHFADEPRGYQPCMDDAARALPNVVPDGMKVTMHCWKERTGGPRLHNRYVITDVCGVQFGDSIERGETGHLDRVSILEEPSRAKLWDQFVGVAPAFEAAGVPGVFEGRRGSGRR
jgi:hypothetical protein